MVQEGQGQRGRMYGHRLGNVMAKSEGQKTNWVHFSLDAVEERRFIVTTTIVAFPTVPLLQQAGILYRRPLWVTKRCTKSVFHVSANLNGHIHTFKLGTRRVHIYNYKFSLHTITPGMGTQIYIHNNHRVHPRVQKRGYRNVDVVLMPFTVNFVIHPLRNKRTKGAAPILTISFLLKQAS